MQKCQHTDSVQQWLKGTENIYWCLTEQDSFKRSILATLGGFCFLVALCCSRCKLKVTIIYCIKTKHFFNIVFEFIIIMTTCLWHSRMSLSSFKYFKLANCHAKFCFTLKAQDLNLIFALIKNAAVSLSQFPTSQDRWTNLSHMWIVSFK